MDFLRKGRIYYICQKEGYISIQVMDSIVAPTYFNFEQEIDFLSIPYPEVFIALWVEVPIFSKRS